MQDKDSILNSQFGSGNDPDQLLVAQSAEAHALHQLPGSADPSQLQSWSEIEAGRFMPVRIRGSCVGRALG